VIQSPDPVTRTLAARILLWQAAVTVAIAIICLAGWGASAALSALAGGGTGVLANMFMTLTALRPSATPAGALGRLLLGQLMKVAVTATLFVLAARTGRVVWPAMLVAFVATLVVFWFVPVLATRMRRVKIGQA
jgi:F0F1-type ATP synthase assembly protein I